MTKIEIGRTIVEDTEQIRIYHGKVLLSQKRLPIIAKHITEVTNWLYLYQQGRVREELERYASDMQNQMGGGLGLQNEAPTDMSTHPLVQAVIDIEGVEFAIGASYQLVVIKGRQFTWELIEKKILRLITSFSMDDLEHSNLTVTVEEPAKEEPVASPTPGPETSTNL